MYTTFNEWMRKVDRVLVSICGMGHYELPDQPYHDWYDSEMPPQEAAHEALVDAGFPLDLLEADMEE